MSGNLTKTMPRELKARMQGNACFNFKTIPQKELLAELRQLTAAAVEHWAEKKWL